VSFDPTADLARIRYELHGAAAADLARRARSRTRRLAATALVLVAGLGVGAWAATRPTAGDVAPLLQRPATPGDTLVLPTVGSGSGIAALQTGSARLLDQTPGATTWVMTNASGELCVVTRVAVRPTQTTWGCGAPSVAAASVFRALGVSMTSASPDARPWQGVLSGLVRPDVAALRVTFEGGRVERVAPNADGGFIADETSAIQGGPPLEVVALSRAGSVLESYALGRDAG
jgi:hypothetical protein